MSDPLIDLPSGRVSVQPGGQARITVTLSNTGSLVEGYQLQVLGPTAAWSQVDPPEVSVYPGQSASVAVVFSPPSGTGAPAGTHPFGVIARSTLDSSSAVAEGNVEVAKVLGLQAKVVPVTSSGRWRGQHTVQVTNWGNAPAQLRMTASDPDEALGFYLRPSTISVPPGGRATVRLSARARRPFLRGSPVRLPFEVVGEPFDGVPGPPPGPGYGDPSRPVVTAALNQKPILSAGVVTLFVALLVGVLGLGAYLVLRPEPPELPLSDRSAPTRPALIVSATGPTAVRVRWDPVELADAYDLQQVDRTTSDVLREFGPFREVNNQEITDLPSATEVCFRLRASRGAVKGPWSANVCAPTAPATQPSASGSSSMPTSTWAPRKPLPPLRAVRGSVTIDGDTGDWQWQQVARANQPIIGQTSASGDIYLMWDDQALYLMAQVRDGSLNAPDPSLPAQVYRGDAVILELGPDNRGLAAADLARPSDAYYMVGLAPQVVPPPSPTAPLPTLRVPTVRVVVPTVRVPTVRVPATAVTRTPSPRPPTGTNGVLGPNANGTSFEQLRDASQITSAVKPSADGYVLEARIPWATTGLRGVAPGVTLAANVLVSDRRPDSLANRGMVSTNEQRSADLRAHPYYWQQLELLS